LEFEPFAIAVSPRSGNIALLYEEKRQVHLFSEDGSQKSTIYIEYGDLWDVAFSIDDDVIVVNRTHNRLLFYEKDGQFINWEVEVPRSCLKFTYLSVDEIGRLIVTGSAAANVDDDVVNCIIVYQCGEEESDRMFGRRHLQHPVSRAIFYQGFYYVADRCSHEIIIIAFTVQGEPSHILAPTPGVQVRISVSSDPFSGGLVICCCNSRSGNFVKINASSSDSKKLSCPHFVPKQVGIQSKIITRGKCMIQVEIYENEEYFNIVKYPI
jgi:hypothetical protein